MPAQHWPFLPKHHAPPPTSSQLGVSFVPTSSVLPLRQPSTYKSALFIPYSPCATFRSLPLLRPLCTCSAPLLSRGGAGISVRSARIHARSTRIRSECPAAASHAAGPSVQHRPQRAAAAGLAASLQKHVERVHHAFTQVGRTARLQQRAQFEGFGHAVLVDIRQQVLIPLAAQDDLGVVVVKVHLWRLKG